MREIHLVDEPEISVIVPMYNAAKYIAATLSSLLKQQFEDFEIIVVDDGSTDDSAKIVQHFFFDRRIKYTKKENGGTGSALNVGHSLARGKYITRCSADNIYFPDFLSTLVSAIEQLNTDGRNVQLVYSDFVFVDDSGRVLREVRHNAPQSGKDLIEGYDVGMSFLYTKELWNKTGEYWNRICEDYNWVVRAAEYTSFGLVKKPLAAFRVHPGQITGSRQEEEKAAANDYKALARALFA